MIKYVRLKKGDAIVLFPDSIMHNEIAKPEQVESAGFVNLTRWSCYGESTSLKVKSMKKIDTLYLRSQYQRSMEDEI